MTNNRSVWAQLPQHTRAALTRSWDSGVPAEASALHARWWQLETWLRSLAYVELRAKYGPSWLRQVPAKAIEYAKNETRFNYMSSSDAELVLSYLDFSHLFDLLDAHWDIFETSLIEKSVWLGRSKELRQIRHRNAHCRRPHQDDLSRMEQILRDLENGAFKAATSFNRREWPSDSLDDPLVDAWVRRTHPAARRLIDHAASNYGVDFEFSFSQRPWTDRYKEGSAISGTEGYLWHASFVLHNDGIELGDLWGDHGFNQTGVKEGVIFLCSDSPYNVDISFSALADPDNTADLIGKCFDSILLVCRRGLKGAGRRDSKVIEKWMQRGAGVDPRVQARTAWATVEEGMKPISLFSAGLAHKA